MPAPVLTAYAGPADLQVYYDWREIGELCSDSNETLSANDQLTNPNVIRALNRGAGDIETNLMVSKMYSVADLTSLTGNSKEILIAMNCEMAIVYLFERKPLYNVDKLKAYREIKESRLKMLATGLNVFNLTAQISAGTPEATGLSVLQYSQSGLTAYHPGMHYFPVPRPIFGNG